MKLGGKHGGKHKGGIRVEGMRDGFDQNTLYTYEILKQ